MNLDDFLPARRHLATAAAVVVTGAGWIHLLAAEDHRSHAYVAAFFVATAALQLSWAALVLYKVTRRLLLMALVGNLGLVLLWVFSRTTGVVFVPGVRYVEPVGIPDAAASGLELIAAAALGLLLATRRGDLTVPAARILVAGAASLTLLLVIVAGATGTAHHHDHVHPATLNRGCMCADFAPRAERGGTLDAAAIEEAYKPVFGGGGSRRSLLA